MKRIFDIAVSAGLLALTWPLMLIAAIGIALSSPGPLLYRAERAGRRGERFAMLKFRTMRVQRDAGSEITARNDKRVFPWGRLLRTAKIDELPQLFNVLRGEMAIVGPRPESIAIVASSYNDWMLETLAVRPGITSPGAIFGYTHGESLLDDADPESSYRSRVLAPKLAIERAYIERATVLTDIMVIVRTAWTILAIVFGKRDFALPREARSAGRWHRFAAECH